MNPRRYFTIVLILFAAASRLLPHSPNFAPITALALFSGVYLRKQESLLVPIAALFLSDIVLGFYSGMIWVYGSFLIIAAMGIWLRNHRDVLHIAGATLAGSVIFFVVSNFGVWLGILYPHTLSGFTACYVAAIPFFRNALTGDILYTAALFSLYEFGIRTIPVLRTGENS